MGVAADFEVICMVSIGWEMGNGRSCDGTGLFGRLVSSFGLDRWDKHKAGLLGWEFNRLTVS
jgi:hypothetical protein